MTFVVIHLFKDLIVINYFYSATIGSALIPPDSNKMLRMASTIADKIKDILTKKIIHIFLGLFCYHFIGQICHNPFYSKYTAKGMKQFHINSILKINSEINFLKPEFLEEERNSSSICCYGKEFIFCM